MKIKNFVWILSLFIVCTFALAEEPDQEQLRSNQRFGSKALVEANGQLGVFSGIRLYLPVLNRADGSVGLIGSVGTSVFGFTALLPKTYEIGIKSEFGIGKAANTQAWQIAPALSTFIIPANKVDRNPRELIDLNHAFNNISSDIWALAPNVDLRFLHKLTEKVAMVWGGQIGLATVISGTDEYGKSLRGSGSLNLGIYVGARI